ncbi:agmatine deiminase family protein [Streptomyces sp. CB01881]|uniref:agmatine deiminase family protein n=1 Tax=Streptomyces sp. CB01881 TaxID=2078691 RepID=UPI000CDC4299|nr:agmatine deiminase family protein [Streptomyces sp. CB01881]AUY48205.1 peptidyl-arginine deiminase [Streptomyces sp. CB01881]TYC76692.1 agmatine deiminase family protein [Streptomyces sp. CB01881]
MPNALSRRTLMRSLAGAGVGALTLGLTACDPTGAGDLDAVSPSQQPGGAATAGAGARRFGAEWEKHLRTVMSWPASESVWGDQLPDVRRDVAGLAQAIAAREPVVLMARPEQKDAAQKACGSAVEVVPIAVDDLWARDTLPVFVEEGGKVKGVDFNFNGWGGKQQRGNDSEVARAVLAKYGVERIETRLVAEGGSFETDGQGTLLVTESSVVNDNRNPGMTRDQVEAELKKALGVTKVVWLAGVKGKDITDAHVDCLTRFVAPGVVLLDQAFPGTPADVWSRAADQARTALKNATDASGRKLEVVELQQPDPDRITGRGDAFVSSYMNFYIGAKGVYLPKFGDDRADGRAQQIMKQYFPGREIVPVKIDAIAAGGGGIHCATHDIPALG